MKTKTIAVLFVVGVLLAYGLVSVSAYKYEAWCKGGSDYCCSGTDDSCGTGCNANSGTCYPYPGNCERTDGLSGTYSANAYSCGTWCGGTCPATGGNTWAWSAAGKGYCECAKS